MLRKNKFATATIIGALAAAFTLVAPINAAQAATVNAGSYATLELAVAAANPGDTVSIPAGTYSIDNPLVLNGVSLQGQGTVVIQPSGTFTYGATVTAYDQQVNPLIWAQGATVTIDSITLKGPGPDAQYNGSASSGDGILSSAASFTLSNSIITGIRQQPMGTRSSGRAVVVGEGNATISNCAISDFQKNGITSYTSGTMTVDNCTITGSGPAGLSQNGIVVWHGTANLTNNTISNLAFSGSTGVADAAAGILAYQGASTDSITITGSGNTISNTQVGVEASGASNSNGNVSINVDATVTGSTYGACSVDPASTTSFASVTCNGTPITPGAPYWTVTFLHANGSIWSTMMVKDGTVLTASMAPTATGFVVTWPGFPPAAPVTADQTFTAAETGVNVVVSYDLNAPCCSEVQGSVPKSVQGKAIPFGSVLWTPSAKQASAANYTFAGWSTRPDPTSRKAVVFAAGDPLNNWGVVSASKPNRSGQVTYSVTLYAVWAGVPVTVQFDANAPAKKLNVSHMPDSQTVPFCTTVQLPKGVPTAKGYTFVGWNTAADGTGTMLPAKGKVLIDTFVAPKHGKSGDNTFTLYAQWIVTPKNVTVTYDANAPEGATASGTMDPVTVDFGKSFTAAENGFTVDGWTFTGWNTAADGSGDAIAVGDVVKVTMDPAQAFVTLFAQWTQSETPTPSEPSTPGGGGSAVAPTGGSVAGSPAGIVGVLMLVAAGGVFMVSRRRFAAH